RWATAVRNLASARVGVTDSGGSSTRGTAGAAVRASPLRLNQNAKVPSARARVRPRGGRRRTRLLLGRLGLARLGRRGRRRLRGLRAVALHVDAAAEVRAVGNRNARRREVAVDRPCIADIDLLRCRDVAADFALDDDRLREDLGLDAAVGADGQHVLTQFDLAVDLPFDREVFTAAQFAFDDDGLADVHVRALLAPGLGLRCGCLAALLRLARHRVISLPHGVLHSRTKVSGSRTRSIWGPAERCRVLTDVRLTGTHVRFYLDHNATSPVHPEVAALVARLLTDEPGNPSSVHTFGQRAKAVLDDARSRVAALIDAEPGDVVFTAGGTEADNLAIRGAAEALAPTGRRHLVASAIEHEAVLATMKALERRGWRVSLVRTDASGIVDPDAIAAVVDDETALVSVMYANNEIGTIQPVRAIADIAHARGALFHTDAVQAAGKIPVSVRDLGVDLLAIAGHKFNGPKGTGALWIRRGVRLVATETGGRQERNRR